MGKTPVAIACGTGGARSLKLLIEAGADINSADRDGVVPMHECFYRGNNDCLIELLKAKPDTSRK